MWRAAKANSQTKSQTAYKHNVAKRKGQSKQNGWTVKPREFSCNNNNKCKQNDDSSDQAVISAEFRQMTHMRRCSQRLWEWESVRVFSAQRISNERLEIPIGSFQSLLWCWKPLFVYNALNFTAGVVNKQAEVWVLSRKYAKYRAVRFAWSTKRP